VVVSPTRMRQDEASCARGRAGDVRPRPSSQVVPCRQVGRDVASGGSELSGHRAIRVHGPTQVMEPTGGGRLIARARLSRRVLPGRGASSRRWAASDEFDRQPGSARRTGVGRRDARCPSRRTGPGGHGSHGEGPTGGGRSVSSGFRRAPDTRGTGGPDRGLEGLSRSRTGAPAPRRGRWVPRAGVP